MTIPLQRLVVRILGTRMVMGLTALVLRQTHPQVLLTTTARKTYHYRTPRAILVRLTWETRLQVAPRPTLGQMTRQVLLGVLARVNLKDQHRATVPRPTSRRTYSWILQRALIPRPQFPLAVLPRRLVVTLLQRAPAAPPKRPLGTITTTTVTMMIITATPKAILLVGIPQGADLQTRRFRGTTIRQTSVRLSGTS